MDSGGQKPTSDTMTLPSGVGACTGGPTVKPQGVNLIQTGAQGVSLMGKDLEGTGTMMRKDVTSGGSLETPLSKVG